MSFLCCCFASTPPEKVGAKGRAGEKYGKMLAMQDQPNAFQTNLCDAPCADCPMCCLTGLFPCCMAGKWRTDVLNQYGAGISDYVCCQGYVPKICCCDFPNMCKGSVCGLWCESCCCDTLSLSFSRIYVMEKKQLHPDPVDYQIIAFSNCMQYLACFCHILAYVSDAFDTLACIVDMFAEAVERTVSGCMGAQINLEIKHSKSQGGAPALTVADEKVEEAPEVESVEVAAVIERD
jgi:hypothetical protein